MGPMTTMSEERRRAVRAFGRWMASPEGIAVTTKKDALCNAFVVVDSEESIKSVFERMADYEPPVIIAVWFASRDKFTMVKVRPEPRNGATASSDPTFGMASTIGMLADDIERNHTVTFKLSKWSESVEFRLPSLA